MAKELEVRRRPNRFRTPPLWRDWDNWVQDFFEPFFLRRPLLWEDDMDALTPTYHIRETDSEYILSFDVPGMREEDLQVEASGNQLKVRGERHEKATNGKGEYHRSYRTALTLPNDVDPDKISADLENGVLEVRVPKSEEGGGRKIQIGGRQRRAPNDSSKETKK